MKTPSATSSSANQVARQSRRRRRLNRPISISGPQSAQVLRYAALGAGVGTDANGLARDYFRLYVPGNPAGFTSPTGPTVAGYYSTGKFLPGTTVEWVPSVGFTTSGRVYIGFTDNPELASTIISAVNTASYATYVKGLGDVISFPVYQNEKFSIPTRLRRKMFDTNVSLTNDVNVLDRSLQTAMFVLVDGAPASTAVGGFRFEDHLMVEGLTGVVS